MSSHLHLSVSNTPILPLDEIPALSSLSVGPTPELDSDPALLLFLRADDEEESRGELAFILSEYVEPLVKNIVGYKMGVFLNRDARSHRHQEAEDLFNEVLLKVIARLSHLKSHPELPIVRFQGYVAVIAYRVCQRYTARRRRASHTTDSHSRDASDDRAFDVAGTLDTAVNNFAAAVEERDYLRFVWKEICELPLRQRVALLLNLKDARGANLVALLPLTGIATVSEIARTLSLSAEQFAQLWITLPLDDEAIARRLTLTRQQVINLRKSGRRRLARRAKKLTGGGQVPARGTVSRAAA